MNRFKSICFLGMLFYATISIGQKTTYGDSLCINYIMKFKPNYLDNSDTLVVARFPVPDSTLILYLEESIRNLDYSSLKYASVVIIKLTEEHSKVNHSTYMLDEDGRKNPFIKLVLAYIETKEKLNDEIFYFELSEWLYNHRSEIEGFKKTRRKFR